VIDGINLPQLDGSVKAVFSAFVLQHLDEVEIGFSYFREFHRVLEAGGTLMIQLPLYQFPYRSKPMQTLAQAMHAFTRWLGKIHSDRKRRAGIKIMRMTSYPAQHLYDSLVATGFKDVQFRSFSVRSNGDLHSFVFATK
jgi:predicted SAM-dependent methyltransferase